MRIFHTKVLLSRVSVAQAHEGERPSYLVRRSCFRVFFFNLYTTIHKKGPYINHERKAKYKIFDGHFFVKVMLKDHINKNLG